MYFSGQGKVYLAARNPTTGEPTALGWVGNVSKLEVALNVETLEHRESYSGNRLTDVRLETGKTASLSATFEEWDAEYLARVLRSSVVTNSVTPVVAEVVETLGALLTAPTEAAPARFQTKGRNIGGSFTLVDSTGSPKTLLEGTHWRLVSAAAGIVEVYSVGALGPLTEPLKISYTPGASRSVGMLVSGASQYYLTFDGLNTANNNAPMVAELYKVQFSPPANLSLITNELGTFEVAGSVLLDELRSSSGALGQFGKITYT